MNQAFESPMKPYDVVLVSALERKILPCIERRNEEGEVITSDACDEWLLTRRRLGDLSGEIKHFCLWVR